MTAGLFQSELAAIPGASAILIGGMVTYSTESKITQLGIPQEIIEEHGVVSGECAVAMAMRIKEAFNTDIGVGLTGAAGPSSLEGKPAGTVWIAIAFPNGIVKSHELHLSDMRNTNRLRVVKRTCYEIIHQLTNRNES